MADKEEITYETGSCFQYIFGTLLNSNKKLKENFSRDGNCKNKSASIKPNIDYQEKFNFNYLLL